MFKKNITKLLVAVLFVLSVFPVSSASSATISPGLRRLTSSSYAKVFTLENRAYYNIYSNSDLTTRLSSSAWTGYNDEIWITGVGINSNNVAYAQIKYPYSNGGRSGYCYMNLKDTFVPGSENSEARTATSRFYGLATRKEETKNYSYGIDSGDSVYLLTKDSGWCQILYPISGSLWRIAWLTESEYNNLFPDPTPDPTPVTSDKYDASKYQSYPYSSYAGNCFMFARLVKMNEGNGYFDTYTSDYRRFSSYYGGRLIAQHLNDVSGTPSESDIRNAFSKAQVGDVVQMLWQWSSVSQHTAIISAIGSNYVEFLEANNPRGKIANNRYSFGSSANGNYGALQTLYSRPGNRGGFSIYRFGSDPIEITVVPDIPVAIAGTPYSFQCKAEGNVSSWSMSNGIIPSNMDTYYYTGKNTIPPGLSVNSSTGLINGTPQHTSEGKRIRGAILYYFKVNASNSQGSSEKQACIAVWEPPAITTKSQLTNGKLNQSYNQTVSAEGAEYSMKWKVKWGSLPPGLSLSNTNSRNVRISGTPTARGHYSFDLECSNLAGTYTRNFMIIIDGVEPYSDTALKKMNSDFSDGTEGEYYEDFIGIRSNNFEGFTISGNYPKGLSFSRSANAIIMKGTPNKAGTYEFTITPYRTSGAYYNNDVKVTIKSAKSSRYFADSSMSTKWTFGSGKLGISYSDWVLVQGGSSPYTTSLVKGTLPPGLEIKQSGIYTYLKGVPKRYGSFTFTLRFLGSHNGYVEKEFYIYIYSNSAYRSGDAADGSSSKPKFSSKELPNAAVGTEWEATLEASGTTPITWFAAEPLPGGFILNEETGKLSGIPMETGKYKFRIRAENAIGSTTKTLKLKVVAEKPAILTTSLPDGYLKTPYEVTLDFSGTEPIKFKKIGSLPSGLKLNKKTGVISGTPKKAGTYKFSVTAKNKSGSDTVNLKITINEKEPTKDAVESSSMTKTSSLSLTENSNVQNNVSTNSENKGFSTFITELYLISGDEELKDCITTEAEKPLTFAIDEWIDAYGRSVEVSNVKVFINEEPLDDLEISDEGVFTLSGDIVNNEFIIYATALTGSQELRTSEVNIIVGNQEKNISSSEYDNKQNDDKNSSGGCNINFLGIIGIMIFGVVILRKTY